MRTDRHAPASIDFDPAEYNCVGVFDMHPEDGTRREYVSCVSSLVKSGYRFASHQESGRCGHCGAVLRYVAIMLRDKEMILVGETCLDNRFELTKDEFQTLRKSAMLNRERRLKGEKINAFCEQFPELAWFTYPEYLDELNNAFVYDIASKFRANGELSERQIESGIAAMLKAEKWRAEREAEKANKTNAPAGKQTVKGVVKARKEIDSMYGMQYKMLVMDDRGFTVWVSVPNALASCERGMRVQFNCTLEVSSQDSTHAFGKRPTKAIYL